jgi:hypothetical protein
VSARQRAGWGTTGTAPAAPSGQSHCLPHRRAASPAQVNHTRVVVINTNWQTAAVCRPKAVPAIHAHTSPPRPHAVTQCTRYAGGTTAGAKSSTASTMLRDYTAGVAHHMSLHFCPHDHRQLIKRYKPHSQGGHSHYLRQQVRPVLHAAYSERSTASAPGGMVRLSISFV